jgi:hypothetical protein
MEISRNLEPGIPPGDLQYPTAFSPLTAKPFEGGDVAARCLHFANPN